MIQKKIKKIELEIHKLHNERIELSSQIPSNWKLAHEEFKKLSNNKKKSLKQYRRNVDEVYENIQILKSIINDKDKLNKIEDINKLQNIVMNQSKEEAMKFMKSLEKKLDQIEGTSNIKEKISKSRRALKKNNPDMNKIMDLIDEANKLLIIEKEWRSIAEKKLLPDIINFDNKIKDTIGLRLQEKLTKDQAKFVAACRSIHKDISLNF